jgi:hypothetical protein
MNRWIEKQRKNKQIIKIEYVKSLEHLLREL